MKNESGLEYVAPPLTDKVGRQPLTLKQNIKVFILGLKVITIMIIKSHLF